MSVTVREALKLGMQKLRDIQNAELDVWVLLSYIMKIDNHLNLSLIQDQYISEQSIDAFISLLERREKREPIALIIGYKEFWSLNFYVNKSTLIPRPETELIIDSVLERCKRDEYKMLDLGVGSGCISIALLHEYQASECMGVDFSEEALSVAKINAVTHNVAHRLNFVKSNWLDEVPKTQFDIIVSNPPYISLDDMNLLMPDVSFFEPHSALTDFNDGMKQIYSSGFAQLYAP